MHTEYSVYTNSVRCLKQSTSQSECESCEFFKLGDIVCGLYLLEY